LIRYLGTPISQFSSLPGYFGDARRPFKKGAHNDDVVSR
jgi:hypothetical protein